ncbi:hypothetical protein X975_11920, partial [Stegodyphus mimosarum]
TAVLSTETECHGIKFPCRFLAAYNFNAKRLVNLNQFTECDEVASLICKRFRKVPIGKILASICRSVVIRKPKSLQGSHHK